MKKTLWTTSLTFGLIVGCASGGNCRQQAEANQKKEQASGMDSSKKSSQEGTTVSPSANVSTVDRVRVFKYDGSLQCGMGKAITPETMKSEFKDIVVHSAESKMDGLMHMQACGTITGQANVFQINKSQLAEAKKLGFKEWLWE